jgi:hypothetical protein
MSSFLITQKPSGVAPGIGNDPNGQTILSQSFVLTNSQEFRSRQSGQLSDGVWRSSGTLLGVSRVGAYAKANCVSKGTSEAWSSRTPDGPANGAHTDRLIHMKLTESTPKRRPSGGASVVVRGRESRPHGEGRQDVSFWTTERFNNWKGFR